MRRAVKLSQRASGHTSPNPLVGAVVLDESELIVGEGWHARAGGPHAEVTALRQAGERARGGTMVVTLEPCTHIGRTGPCVKELLAAGVSRVVIGAADPDPVAAGGAEYLRQAGITVVEGVEEEAAQWSNRAWLTAVVRERPYLVWKFAATLDGRSAAADGTSKWITGPAARADVQVLRSHADAIMTGVGTVIADNPALTVRLATYDGEPPLRVVVDSAGRTPAAAQVRQDGLAPTWIATAAEVGADANGRVDLHRLMARLYERDIRHVFLEGGPTLAGAALAAGLIDEVVAYTAPVLLGAGSAALADAGITTMAEALRLEVREVRTFDQDIRVICTTASRA